MAESFPCKSDSRRCFKIPLKGKGLIPFGKGQIRFENPRSEFLRVGGFPRVVLSESLPKVLSEARIDLVRYRLAAKKVDVKHSSSFSSIRTAKDKSCFRTERSPWPSLCAGQHHSRKQTFARGVPFVAGRENMSPSFAVPATEGILRGLRRRRMADREGFEPSVPMKVHTLSKRAHSTTLTSVLCVP